MKVWKHFVRLSTSLISLIFNDKFDKVLEIFFIEFSKKKIKKTDKIQITQEAEVYTFCWVFSS